VNRRIDNAQAESKRTKRQAMIYKAIQRKLKIEQNTNPTKFRGKLRCSGMKISSCSTIDT